MYKHFKQKKPYKNDFISSFLFFDEKTNKKLRTSDL